jgi:hypothetical protein
MEQEETRLSRDRHTNLVRQLQSSASLEVLFRQEHLHMTEELDLIFRPKLPKERNVAREYSLPFGRDRLSTQPLSPALLRKAKDHAGSLRLSEDLRDSVVDRTLRRSMFIIRGFAATS